MPGVGSISAQMLCVSWELLAFVSPGYSANKDVEWEQTCLMHLLQSVVHLRIGNKEGFDNFETKKLHDVGCAVMQTVNLAIHENVKEYQEDCSEIHEVRPKCLLESADARIRI